MTTNPVISDDLLRAFVDGELDDAERARVEQAVAADPALALRLARERALREQLRMVFDPVLDEPVPARLTEALKSEAAVVDVDPSRLQRQAANDSRGWGWPQWGAMAACLLLGLFGGRWLPWPSAQDGLPLAQRSGTWVAQGLLAHALSNQLASTQAADAPVRVGISFLSREQRYCRSFAWRADAAGVACREGEDWALQVWTQQSGTALSGGDLRMAATPIPAAVLKVVDDSIQGAPLDAEAERAAAAHGWRR